jgi:hypothetical protein
MFGIGIEVQGLWCPRCHDVIYSRARHDFHSCSCGGVSVDGGFEYMRGLQSIDLPGPVESVKLLVQATKDELYDDWNRRINEYGIIRSEEVDESAIRRLRAPELAPPETSHRHSRLRLLGMAILKWTRALISRR